MRIKFILNRIILLLTCLTTSLLAGAEKPKSEKIKSVTFKNNTIYPDQRLRKLMVCRPPTLFGPTVYHPDIFQDDLKNIILFYKQNGYLEARIVDSQVQMDSSQQKIHISITVKEGELTSIEEISVLGNRIFTDVYLRKIIKIKTGDPFARKKVKEATLNLLRLYADHGYLEAEVIPDARIDSVEHRAILDFRIREGLQYRVGDIILKEVEKTKPFVIHRELQFKPGDILNYSLLLKSQRRLYLTGLFESVFIRPLPARNEDSTSKDIQIDIKENPSIELNTSVGYGSVERLRGKMEVNNRNVAGSARKIGLSLSLSFIQRGLEASFTEPWTFATPWQTDLNLGTEYKEEPGYHLYQYGGRLSMGRTFLQHLNIMTRLRIQQGELSEIKVKNIPKEVKTDIRSLEISLIHDTRDNLFNPRQGFYTELSGELGGSFTRRLHGFLRFKGNFKYFYSRSSKTVLATGMEIGIMEADGGLSKIPLSERFYAGGPNSIRGFRYQKLGPLDEEQVPVGGQFKWEWHIIEIRHNLYKMFNGVVFLDMGNVWSSPENFRFQKFRFSPGLGLRLDTPIGVGRIDLGINWDPQPGEPRFHWSFSMGQAF
ncbi:MAG: outer membrane protein assembly factor BamA [bacterium]